MLNHFIAEYSERSDDELLHLASERRFLTTEAAAALDAELRHRNLTESDRLDHQRFVKRQEQREAAKHRRKAFGPFKYQMSCSDILTAFGALALIFCTYIALPRRFHFVKPDWQDAAFIVITTSVITAFACRKAFWRTFAVWISLGVSSAIQLFVIHALTLRVGELGRGVGKGASLLGFLLFCAVYGLVRLSQRIFNNQVLTGQTGGGHVPSS